MKLRAFAVLAFLCLGLEAVALAQTTAPPFAFPTGSMSTARVGHTATLLQDYRVLIAGGSSDGSNALSSAEVYDPTTGAFTATTGSMGAARGYHTATLLQNGKVLITGGYSNGSYLSSAEIYDPAAGTFAATGSMSAARAFHTATLLNDGRVLITGGYNGSISISSADVYDPVAGTFAATGSMSTARDSHTATLLQNGKVLITGGENTGNPVSSAELYDPTPGTFTPTTGSMSTARLQHTATLLNDGRVLIAGGSTLNTAEIFDPATGTFTATGSMGAARYLHTATLLNDGRVQITGGGSGGYLSSAEAYDPTMGTFTATGSMSTARRSHTATLLQDGRVLIAGGGNGGGTLSSAELFTPFTPTAGSMSAARYAATSTLLNSGQVLVAGGESPVTNTADIFDPSTGVFTATGAMSTARFLHTATLLNNGRVLITGGTDGTTAFSSAELYDPITGTFTATGAMSTLRQDHTATLLPDGRVLIAGGYNAGASLNTAEIYDPATGAFTATGSLSAARLFHTATLLNNGLVLVTGGQDAGPLDSAEIYDPASGSFVAAGNMTATRALHTATLLNDGRVLLIGGSGTGNGTAELYDPATGQFASTGSPTHARALLRDFASGGFASTGNPTTARTFPTATLRNDGQVLVTGGFSGVYESSAEAYNPATGAFTPVGAMSTARYGHRATLLNDGRVLLEGGVNNLGFSNSAGFNNNAELFTPTSLTPPNLVSITLSPANPTILTGTAQAFVATGFFSDEHNEILQSVTWSSSSTAVASITNDASNHGHAYGLASSTISIQACAGSVCGSTFLTVQLPQFGLSVSLAGAGAGSVTSSPAGINCGTTCAANFFSGTQVVLAATPARGSVFAGWGGACSGTGPCSVTMNSAQLVTANFDIAPFAVAVSPASITLPVGTTQRFIAIVTGSLNTAVTWSVNGIVGGNATVGTISASGVYSAPASPVNATVTATAAADPTKFASATVTVTQSAIIAEDWGYNGYGELGNGTLTTSNTPVQVSGLSGLVSISGGYLHSMALKSDGTVWAWGWNAYGQLGNGTNTDSSTPVQLSSLSGVVAISAGYYHSLALKNDGTVWAWGYNAYGQLGNGTFTTSSTPVQVSGLSGVVAISGGWVHSLALTSDGTVWAWGDNSYGELGNGTFTSSNTPVQVSGLSAVVAIAGGLFHSLALTSDGTVWAWGDNSYGELGNGTSSTRSNTAVQASSLSGVVAVATGYYHSLALKSDGTVWAWGYNGDGELGNGTFTNSSTPAQATSLSAVVAIAGGYLYSLALKSDGTVWAWGYNGNGQLGNGTFTSSSTPASSFSGAVTISAGAYHGLALSLSSLIAGTLDHFAVSPSTFTPNAGVAFSVTVTAQDGFNSTITGYTGTVHFSLTNLDAAATLPADYTFVAGDNGTHTFTSGVSLTVVGAQSLNVNDTVQTVKTGSAAITVNGQVDLSVSAGTTSLVSFDPLAATLVDYDPIPVHFGSTPQVTVSYVTEGAGTGGADVPNISWWGPGYGDLNSAGFAVANGFFADVYLTGLNGSTVTLNGFDISGYPQIDKPNETLQVYADGSLVRDYSPFTALGAGPIHSHVTPGATGNVVRLRWGIDWNAGINNINFTSGAPTTMLLGATATITPMVFNNNPTSTATGVSLSYTVPTGLVFISATSATMTCSGTATVVCTQPSLAPNSAASAAITVQAAATGTITNTVTVSGNETDPNSANNSTSFNIQVIPAARTADLSVSVVPAGGSAATVTVTNLGPGNATNVVLTDTLDRFGFVSATPSQGGPCTFAASVVTCPLGALAAGASATVTMVVTAPSQGWAAQSFIATSNTLDLNLGNNAARVGPALSSFNTPAGANVVVSATDSSGDAATVSFASVTRVGSTTISAAAATTAAPAGFRFGTPAVVYDISSNADFTAPIMVALRFNPAWFHHPAKVRLFHFENGFWVDRTTGVNLAAATVSAVTSTLSPFIVVEPLNNRPVANAGAAQALAGLSASGAAVKLDATASSDADGDALTYRWTGPFPEGNGVVTGATPTVTVPLGASTVNLIVNDGENDSAPAAVSITVADFLVAANSAAVSAKRGQSTTLTVAVSPKFAAFGDAVALSCANLPAGITCSFSPAAITPGASGASATLTITTTASAAQASGPGSPRRAPPLFAFWFATLAPFGLVWTAGLRRRCTAVTLALVLLLLIALVACGGGGTTNNANSPSPPTSSSTVTITITGASSGLQHSTTVPLTLQ